MKPVWTTVSAAGAEPVHRLLPEGIQPFHVDVGDVHAADLARHECQFGPSARIIWTGATPPGGVVQM